MSLLNDKLYLTNTHSLYKGHKWIVHSGMQIAYYLNKCNILWTFKVHLTLSLFVFKMYLFINLLVNQSLTHQFICWSLNFSCVLSIYPFSSNTPIIPELPNHTPIIPQLPNHTPIIPQPHTHQTPHIHQTPQTNSGS